MSHVVVMVSCVVYGGFLVSFPLKVSQGHIGLMITFPGSY